MKQKSTPRPQRRILWFVLAVFFCLALAAGFLGGVFFARHAPQQAARLSDGVYRSARDVVVRVRSWRTPAPPTARPDAGPTAWHGGSPIRLFFVPARDPAAPQAHEALAALIGSAREQVWCAFYDLELEYIAEALIERHQSGVQVGIVSDSDYSGRPGIRRCIEAGIPVVFDERSALMHNKFCVVDGVRVWTGSANITENCLYRNYNNALLIESRELAVNFQNEFEEMFVHRKFGATSPMNTAFPTISVLGIGIETYFAPEDGVEQAIIARLSQSTEQIDFMTFVFTSIPIAETMADRLAAGAQVRGVLEQRNAGSQHSRHEYLHQQGAEIHINPGPRTMHHKVIIVDARLVMTGSYNLSANAEKRNDENLLMIHNPEIAQRFVEELEIIIQ